MKFSINLEKNDWLLFQKYLEKELPKSVKIWADHFLFDIALVAILIVSIFLTFDTFEQVHLPTAFATSIIFITYFIFLIISGIKFRIAATPAEDGIFIGLHLFIFDENGITSSGEGYEGFQSWSIVKKIVRTDGMILIFLDTAYAFVFLEDKLDNPDELYNTAIQFYNAKK